MHDKMHITCADGLKAIADKAVDAIIIAGMGGILISEILDAGAITAKSAQQIIMQPMRETVSCANTSTKIDTALLMSV